MLLCCTHLSVLVSCAHLSVRHQKSLNPVVMALLRDPIGDCCGLLRDGEALAEALGKAFQQGTGQLANGAVECADCGRIEGE